MIGGLLHLPMSGKVVLDSGVPTDKGMETAAAVQPNFGKVMPQSLVVFGMVILRGLVDFGIEMAPSPVGCDMEKLPGQVDFCMVMPQNRC